jgi:hypothetical protein
MQHNLGARETPSKIARLAGLVASASVVIWGGAVHAGTYVNFLPGTYLLTTDGPSAGSVFQTPDQTLVVTVSGGTASFSLTGAETASFTLPDDAEIATSFALDSVVFSSSSAGSPSWSTATYPYITFWSTADYGGLTIGTIPGDKGTNVIDNFMSTEGPGQIFSPVPEPAGWAVMLVGVAGLGAALRSKGRTPCRSLG